MHLKPIFYLAVFGMLAPMISHASGQETDPYDAVERRADSLVKLEKYAEAARQIGSVLQGHDPAPGDPGRIMLEYRMAYCLMNAGRDIEAISWYRRVIQSGNSIKDTSLVSDAMSGLGRSYEYTGKHDSAFFWYMEAHRLVRGTTDTARIAREIRNMAQLLRVLRRLDEAITYCHQAIALLPGIDDFKVIANIYNETAYLYELSGKLDSAAYFYKELIRISKDNDYRKGESVGYSNLASVYEKEKRFEEAIALKKQGLEMDRELDDRYGMMGSLVGLSETYQLMEDQEKALESLDGALVLCDTSWLFDLAGIHLQYYRIYKKLDEIPLALGHYETYHRLADRINVQESKKEVSEILTRYETEKKEQEIKLLRQKDLLNTNKLRIQSLVISILVLASLFIGISTWLWVRNKNLELKRINADLHHFLLREEKMKKQAEEGDDGPSPEEPSLVYSQWGLSPRESEILYFLGQGCTNADIGKRLFVSTNTIKFHIKNIYLKLDVGNRIEALMRCRNDSNHQAARSTPLTNKERGPG